MAFRFNPDAVFETSRRRENVDVAEVTDGEMASAVPPASPLGQMPREFHAPFLQVPLQSGPLAANDAGRIVCRWATLAVQFGWNPDDLFGKTGLAVFANGEAIRAIGPDHAITETGRVFSRK
jgi:hypothetical protein